MGIDINRNARKKETRTATPNGNFVCKAANIKQYPGGAALPMTKGPIKPIWKLDVTKFYWRSMSTL
jgi:hypothetical protein